MARQPPPKSEIARLVNAALPLEEREANILDLYEIIEERDKIVEEKNQEIERQKRAVANCKRDSDRLQERIRQLEHELRARPKTPRQLQEIISRSETQSQILGTARQLAEKLMEDAMGLVEALEEKS